MIISDLRVRKVELDDPRYPVKLKAKTPPPEVYVCECDTDEGPFEAPFFINRDKTPDYMSRMLQAFAQAISEMERKAA